MKRYSPIKKADRDYTRCRCGFSRQLGHYVLNDCKIHKVPLGKPWYDKAGKHYSNEEVVFKDIDTMGSQFMGWITRESENAPYMNQWVTVEHCFGLDEPTPESK